MYLLERELKELKPENHFYNISLSCLTEFWDVFEEERLDGLSKLRQWNTSNTFLMRTHTGVLIHQSDIYQAGDPEGNGNRWRLGRRPGTLTPQMGPGRRRSFSLQRLNELLGVAAFLAQTCTTEVWQEQSYLCSVCFQSGFLQQKRLQWSLMLAARFCARCILPLHIFSWLLHITPGPDIFLKKSADSKVGANVYSTPFFNSMFLCVKIIIIIIIWL